MRREIAHSRFLQPRLDGRIEYQLLNLEIYAIFAKLDLTDVHLIADPDTTRMLKKTERFQSIKLESDWADTCTDRLVDQRVGERLGLSRRKEVSKTVLGPREADRTST